MALGKGDGLGVLDSYDEIDTRLKGIRTSLRNKDREAGIKDALKNLNDLRIRVRMSRNDGKKLRQKTASIIDELTKQVLPLIEN